MQMTSALLWHGGDPWLDFRVLLTGEASGPITFVSVNRTVYVVDVTESTYLRARAESWNTWLDDGHPRVLQELVAATPCGLRLRWGRAAFGEYTSTTRIVAVFAGKMTELPDADVLDEGNRNWTPVAHPVESCGAMYCADRFRLVPVVKDASA